ncbi:MAG TPA: hypothetical protein VGX68_20120 [Thermoanaerobaculia bacterium]|jgi:hypothetical protein|nr:hypothetical protein [Thermoanaerobaculia bacterium]
MTEGGLLLGFDARPSKPPEWDERRKRDFLFRLDVVQPLSIDTMIWPSALGSNGLERPDWVGIFDPLWESLDSLRQAVGEAKGMALVAFSTITAGASEAELATLETQLRGVYPDGTPGKLPATIADPAAVQPGWSFLGYDVADLGGGTSGLMNCGFLPEQEDVDALRFRWGPKLNRFHLFDRLEDAREFKDFSNQRVLEHAPFYVDGIWLVEGQLA